MLSILITAYREAATVGRAIEAFLQQLPRDGELVVVCPDLETIEVVNGYARCYPGKIRCLIDSQQGKPAALNIGLKAVSGEIVVLSDGDVFLAENALVSLLAPFQDPQVGAVSGHPVSLNSRNTLLGYWSHVLTDGIHAMRLARDRVGHFLVCSGYLFAIRRTLLEHIPEDALAEDAVISHLIAQQGYLIRYAPSALVFVKYPTTYRDWLRQKVRSAGGYTQDYIRKSPLRMRSAWLEVVNGSQLALTYPHNLKEYFWTFMLFAARLHLWLLVYLKVRLLRRSLSTIWQRVETTK